MLAKAPERLGQDEDEQLDSITSSICMSFMTPFKLTHFSILKTSLFVRLD